MTSLNPLASWTLTSAKPGNGIHQLLDSSPDTYWQSDGTSPHSITCTFGKVRGGGGLGREGGRERDREIEREG